MDALLPLVLRCNFLGLSSRYGKVPYEWNGKPCEASLTSPFSEYIETAEAAPYRPSAKRHSIGSSLKNRRTIRVRCSLTVIQGQFCPRFGVTQMAAPHQKNTLYVGGLEENVNQAVLHAAFIPFGDIKDVTIPLDQATQKHRAFGFVTYLEKEDAAAAMDNMNNAELYGRVLTVNYAQPIRIKGGEQGWASQPLWADADTWFERQQQEEEMQRLQAEHQAVVRAAEEEERKKLAEERQGEVEEQEQNDDPMARAEAERNSVLLLELESTNRVNLPRLYLSVLQNSSLKAKPRHDDFFNATYITGDHESIMSIIEKGRFEGNGKVGLTTGQGSLVSTYANLKLSQCTTSGLGTM
eukprot:Gb_35150 [translate_table: standard]